MHLATIKPALVYPYLSRGTAVNTQGGHSKEEVTGT
jgi:hypothetical protein